MFFLPTVTTLGGTHLPAVTGEDDRQHALCIGTREQARVSVELQGGSGLIAATDGVEEQELRLGHGNSLLLGVDGFYTFATQRGTALRRHDMGIEVENARAGYS